MSFYNAIVKSNNAWVKLLDTPYDLINFMTAVNATTNPPKKSLAHDYDFTLSKANIPTVGSTSSNYEPTASTLASVASKNAYVFRGSIEISLGVPCMYSPLARDCKECPQNLLPSDLIEKEDETPKILQEFIYHNRPNPNKTNVYFIGFKEKYPLSQSDRKTQWLALVFDRKKSIIFNPFDERIDEVNVLKTILRVYTKPPLILSPKALNVHEFESRDLFSKTWCVMFVDYIQRDRLSEFKTFVYRQSIMKSWARNLVESMDNLLLSRTNYKSLLVKRRLFFSHYVVGGRIEIVYWNK